MGRLRIRQAVSRTPALGGEEIPAPGSEVPLKSSWAAALEAWTRNVGPGSTGLEATALTEESESPGQCSVQCSAVCTRVPYPSPPRSGPKLHRGKIHQPLRQPKATGLRQLLPSSSLVTASTQRTARLRLHRLAISPTQITSHFRRRADTGLLCRSTRSSSWTTIHRTHAHIPHGTQTPSQRRQLQNNISK